MLHLNKLNFNYGKLKTSKETKEKLKIISEKFEYYCNQIFDLKSNGENNNNNNDDLVIVELKKNFIKNILCYDKLSIDFCKSILNDYNKNAYLGMDNPNLMIHLPDDIMEEGRFHYDQTGSDEIVTIWTPITDYNYDALAYYKVGALIYKFFKILKIEKFLPKKNITVNKFESIEWSGYFIHKGCLNTSKNISSAIVVGLRFSKEDNSNLIYEDFTEDSIYYNYKITLEFINNLINYSKNKNISTKEKFEYVEKKLKSMKFSINQVIVAKIFSVVAQRLHRNSEIQNNFENLSFLIDMSSYFLDKNNYSSLTRLKKTDFFN